MPLVLRPHAVGHGVGRTVSVGPTLDGCEPVGSVVCHYVLFGVAGHAHQDVQELGPAQHKRGERVPAVCINKITNSTIGGKMQFTFAKFQWSER